MQQQLYAGDSLYFATAGGAYPASAGWVLKYRLAPNAGAGVPIDIQCAPEGSDHRCSVDATTTAAWALGVYAWTSWVDKSGEIYTVASGQITIAANPRSLPAGTDTRSQAAKALADAKAALAAWNPTQRRYRIGIREMEFADPAAILKVVAYWEIEVRREEQAERLAQGLRTGGRFYVRWGR